MTPLLNDELRELRALFLAAGHDIRFVGGCVRDTLHGTQPKDIDLCTDAFPDEQLAIYRSAGIRYVETGLDHGTITVVLNGTPYEVTSLRLDVATDGRRATVEYTRDWIKDLERRDFTINAMSLTFDGELIDPFNGLNDLKNGLVAFVGDAETRIKEDYLRILRWFRFRQRFGMSMSYSARRAIDRLASGLNNISRERIWSEVSKILANNDGPFIMVEMHQMGMAGYMDLPRDPPDLFTASEVAQLSSNPVTLLVSLYDNNAVRILKKWKASNSEVYLADFLSRAKKYQESPFRLMAVDGISREWAVELAALTELDPFDRAILPNWPVPIFPVNGNDLLQLGYAQDKNLGYTLKQLKNLWASNGYGMTKEELLAQIRL